MRYDYAQHLLDIYLDFCGGKSTQSAISQTPIIHFFFSFSCLFSLISKNVLSLAMGSFFLSCRQRALPENT